MRPLQARLYIGRPDESSSESSERTLSSSLQLLSPPAQIRSLLVTEIALRSGMSDEDWFKLVLSHRSAKLALAMLLYIAVLTYVDF
jgi:hypothetical protein